jgi:hypothetical protein
MVLKTSALRIPCALLAAGLLLSGCATLDANECKAADWRQIGRSDGERGYGTGRLDEHRKACAEHGIAPNADRYWLGRSEGLQHYCRLDNALRVGRAGQSYQGVCPPAIDQHFRHWHAAAYEVSRIRAAMDNVNSEIDQHERRLRQRDIDDRERQRLRQAIRELDRRRERLRDDLNDQERRVDRLTQDWRPGMPPR